MRKAEDWYHLTAMQRQEHSYTVLSQSWCLINSFSHVASFCISLLFFLLSPLPHLLFRIRPQKSSVDGWSRRLTRPSADTWVSVLLLLLTVWGNNGEQSKIAVPLIMIFFFFFPREHELETEKGASLQGGWGGCTSIIPGVTEKSAAAKQ